MENGLETELDEELVYGKYDYKNKATDNSRNGHSSKRLRTSFGEADVSVPRDRKGEFEPQVLKKDQNVRSERQLVKKAVYIAIGVNLDGRKDVLGMWVGENESAKLWATVLNGLKNRGVEDIFIACTDNFEYYNHNRIKAKLNRLSPVQYRIQCGFAA